ncbi:MAG: nuclear transport factor 2 family protein [Bacilli bacterium]
MNKKELIETWFKMWVNQKDTGIDMIFTKDIIYMESIGTHYSGIEEIKRWFKDWNLNNRVVEWNILSFKEIDDVCYVEWYFKMEDGKKALDFNGESTIYFKDDKICDLKEYMSLIPNVDPFAKKTL